jgi:hypothetical protein
MELPSTVQVKESGSNSVWIVEFRERDNVSGNSLNSVGKDKCEYQYR